MISFLICGLRFSQYLNAMFPMLVTLSGMLMLVRDSAIVSITNYLSVLSLLNGRKVKL